MDAAAAATKYMHAGPASTRRVDRSKTLREGFCLTTKPNVLNKFINMLMYNESKQN
jgi:hypothetical protein